MPTHHGEVSLQLRVAIATCRLLYHDSYPEIERKLGVSAGTSSRIVNRAIERAGNENFMDILACLGDADRSGRPKKVSNGSEESKET